MSWAIAVMSELQSIVCKPQFLSSRRLRQQPTGRCWRGWSRKTLLALPSAPGRPAGGGPRSAGAREQGLSIAGSGGPHLYSSRLMHFRYCNADILVLHSAMTQQTTQGTLASQSPAWPLHAVPESTACGLHGMLTARLPCSLRHRRARALKHMQDEKHWRADRKP